MSITSHETKTIKQTDNHTRKDIYQTVTDTIVQQLEAGTIPWHRLWQSNTALDFSLPKNLTTGKSYRGINILLLWSANLSKQYTTNEWATFKQYSAQKEQIRKGEKGTMIVYYDTMEVDREGEIEKIPFLKSSIVFNRCQLTSYQPEEKEVEPKTSLVERLAHVDEFMKNTKAIIHIDGSNPCYRAATDTIHMPDDAEFIPTDGSTATKNFYSTLSHELVHWSGHPSRLDRKLKNKYGSELYAGEELVAELGAAFLCSALQITNEPRPEHACYIASWLQAMKDDKKAIVTAASAASKAVDYLTSLQPKPQATPA